MIAHNPTRCAEMVRKAKELAGDRALRPSDPSGGLLAELADQLEAACAEVERLSKRPLRTFDHVAGNRLADEVAVLVRRKVIDARSPAGDALLDYRDPPSTQRSDRMTQLEAERDALLVRRDVLENAIDEACVALIPDRGADGLRRKLRNLLNETRRAELRRRAVEAP